MSTSEFAALTVGARFGDQDAHHKQLFRERPADALRVDSGAEGPGGQADINVPPPSALLNPFARKKQPAETQVGEEPEAEGDSAKAPLKALSAGAVARRMKALNVKTTAVDFVPLTHFSELVRPPHRVPSSIVDVLFEREHRSPTAVQSVCVPLLLQGRDVIACAPTGSGKTLAFLVPLFARLKSPSRTAGVRALVLCPTKELAIQLEREAFFLLKGDRWRLVQHGQSTKDKDVMVTTPARAVQLAEAGKLDLSAVKFVVFDEGDKLWDTGSANMGAIDSVLKLCTSPERVVSLFTATLSERTERLARTVMRDAIRVIVKGRAEASSDVEHKLLFVGNEQGKITAMRNLLREGVRPPVLLFVQSVERTQELFDELKCAGLKAAILNASLSPEERDETVLQFRLGKIWVLISTELLARGIDFKGVGTVINFDFPLSVESYVHRTGRTGRAGKKGTAITFFTESDKERLPAVAHLIKSSGSAVEPWMLERLERVSAKRQKQLERTVPTRAVVSTRKRMSIGAKRVEAGFRRVDREKGTGPKKNRAEASDGDSDELDE